MVYTGGALVGRQALYVPFDQNWVAFVLDGVRYAVPFILFLTVHEFGHYIAARRHRIDVSLPYFIPLGPLGFGTLGAVIRIREPLRRTRQLFDVGAAGPLAGFVIALGLLVYAVATLPPPTYLLDVPGHEGTVAHIALNGEFPPFAYRPGVQAILFGDTPLFTMIRQVVPALPSPSELMHYPVLLAAWLGLFFTALNLLPVGQLDGGHVVYALFGPRIHAVVARIATLLLLLSGAIGWISDFRLQLDAMTGLTWVSWPVLAMLLVVFLWRFFGNDWRAAVPGAAVLMALATAVGLGMPALALTVGYWGWMLWVGLILFLIRLDHPPVLVQEPLTPGRRALGYLCLALFVLCFSIQPIYVPV
ncbi:MAG: site-2 protease family protein [Rhodothermaceae bacterium]|nr:site-2 protease family protein [Rhodothermaceae bacterium]